MRVQFPLPAPSILLIFNGFARSWARPFDLSGYKFGTVRILRILNELRIAGPSPSPTNYI
jgi:hypothetical protein